MKQRVTGRKEGGWDLYKQNEHDANAVEKRSDAGNDNDGDDDDDRSQ